MHCERLMSILISGHVKSVDLVFAKAVLRLKSAFSYANGILSDEMKAVMWYVAGEEMTY